MTASSVTAVVPTVGRSGVLLDCLAALRQEGGAGLRVVLVEQGATLLELPASLGIDRLHTVDPLGFARASNLGIDAAGTRYVALVNDDAVPRAPWLRPLVDALDSDPTAAAAQGVNLSSIDPPRLDGCGLGWNDRWQAVQLLHGRPASDAPDRPREVFGVSATAAVYRRAALHQVAGPDGAFDPRLGSYYEDVDLACRLRAAGHRALLVPGAVCRHLGSSSVGEGERLELVYRNRYLVLARLLGRGFWPRLPWFVLRDLIALFGAATAGDRTRARAIGRGLAAAPRCLPDFASFGRPLVALADARRTGGTLGAEA